jgi:UTP--glucose-1-phosphate uridylyltransferase
VRPVRTAVIPAAGLGTRFLPASKAMPKELVPLVDRPAIQWVVEEAVAAGCTRVVLVVGRGKEAIADHFDRAPELEAALEASGKTALLAEVRRITELAEIILVRQGSPKGLGHAVAVARAAVGPDEPIAVLLPDDIMDPAANVLGEMVRKAEAAGQSVVALQRIEGPSIATKGVVAIDGERITGVVEKPAYEDAPSDLAVIGRYVFTPAVFDALAGITAGTLGELQLTDAIETLAATEGVLGHVFATRYLDTGNHLDWLTANLELALDDPAMAPALAKTMGRLLAERGLG